MSYENMTPEAVKERQYSGDLSHVREPRAPTDLANPRLRKLVSALVPLYIRYGGTTTNTVYFQDDDEPKRNITLAPASVNFIALPNAKNPHCGARSRAQPTSKGVERK